jgi:hypothetical protein
MKHLQYSPKTEICTNDISVEAENKSHNGSVLKSYKQLLADPYGSSYNQLIADTIRNYSVRILVFILTGHAVLGKFKSVYEKNLLAANEVLNILRIIVLAGRNIACDEFPERLLTRLLATVRDLQTQIDAFDVASEAVVTTLWPYIFILWMPH